jgi:hypothetical protein
MGSEGGEEVGEEGALGRHLSLLVLMERFEEEVVVHIGSSCKDRWRLWGGTAAGRGGRGLTRVAGSRGDLDEEV